MIWAGGRMGNANRSASADDSNTRVLPKAETVKGPKPKRVASRSIPARPVTAKAVRGAKAFNMKKDNRERVKSAPAKRVKLIGKSGKDKKSKKTKNDRSKSKPKKEKTRSKSKGKIEKTRSKSKAKN